jgi:hypothetical protein
MTVLSVLQPHDSSADAPQANIGKHVHKARKAERNKEGKEGKSPRRAVPPTESTEPKQSQAQVDEHNGSEEKPIPALGSALFKAHAQRSSWRDYFVLSTPSQFYMYKVTRLRP